MNDEKDEQWWSKDFNAMGCTIEGVCKDITNDLLGAFLIANPDKEHWCSVVNNPNVSKRQLEYLGENLDSMISFCLEARQGINRMIGEKS